MIWLVIGSIVPSLLICLGCGYVIRRYARSWGFVDQPSLRKDHASPTPTSGGVAIWAGVVGALLLGQFALNLAFDSVVKSNPRTTSANEFGNSYDGPPRPSPTSDSGQSTTSHVREFIQPHLVGLRQQSGKLWTLLTAASLLMLLGLADDRLSLDWRLRLLTQFLVAGFLVIKGWQLSAFIPLPWLAGALSVLWLVAVINTFNMLDNMDGLSAGVAAIAATILAAVILTAPDPITKGPQLFVGGFLLVVVGSLLGFLWHNRPPARLFMGDAGSYFVGFCLGAATISATFAGEGLPKHAILAPLCVLAVPFYDTVTVIWIRLREGRSPFHADRNHISHRLVDLGLSKRQAVLVIYGATAICGTAAFFLHRTETLGALLVLLFILAVLAVIAMIELKARKQLAEPAAGQRSTGGR